MHQFCIGNRQRAELPLYRKSLKGTIDVFDHTFDIVSTKPFKDPHLPSGYVPFNIHLIGNRLYVTYTKVPPDGRALKSAAMVW
ncbi:MAG TPA: hypothetical protein VKA49_21165 [Flavitalea sp.]|nr:hypothetical protein [Flavitalea sp.]